MSDQKNVLLSKPGAVSAEDKQALREAGVLVVEVGNPSDVKLLRTGGDEANRIFMEAFSTALEIDSDHDQPAGKLMANLAMYIVEYSEKR